MRKKPWGRDQEGWILGEWKTTENNRQAKLYSLTRAGRRQLGREAEGWTKLSVAITHVVKLQQG